MNRTESNGRRLAVHPAKMYRVGGELVDQLSENMSIEEVGRKLNLTPTQVRTTERRALYKIKAQLLQLEGKEA